MIRNEFSFMVGGEVEDEVEEAAHSHELQEGRDDNKGRRDVLAAIRAMSRAEQMLNRANTTEALPHERAAVDALQRAFSRTRYLLRTLPVRAQIDLDRRLSGDRAGARQSRRVTAPSTDRVRVAATLAIVTRLEAAGQDLAAAPSGELRREFLDVADRVLALDPRSPSLAAIAQSLLDIVSPNVAVEAARRDLFDRAVSALTGDLQLRLAVPAARARSPHEASLRGALERALRDGGAQRTGRNR